MNNTLIVFYSRSGYTRTLAQAIAAAGHADIEEIRETRSRAGVWGYLRSGRDAARRIAVPILPAQKDPAAYQQVIIGGPVWAAHVCAPVRSYLVAQRDKLPDVALFVTYGGRGAEQALAEMAQLCGKTPRVTLAVRDAEVKAGSHIDKAQQLVRSLGRGV